MRIFLMNLRYDNKGVTALEYGLIASLLAIAIIAGVTLLGGNLNTVFNTAATSV